MASKIKKIYGALIEGAEAGKTDDHLYRYVKEKCPKATSKRIVKASLLALTDPDMRDANMLRVIYALAIRHRLDPVEEHDLEPGADKDDDEAEGEITSVKAVPEPVVAGAKPARKRRSSMPEQGALTVV